jgi:hypothetical protein
MRKTMKIGMDGYEAVEKTATKGRNSSLRISYAHTRLAKFYKPAL